MITSEELDIISCYKRANYANVIMALAILSNPLDPGRKQALSILEDSVESLVSIVDALLVEVKNSREQES